MKVKDIEFFFDGGSWSIIISGKKFELRKCFDYKAVVKILECDFSEVSRIIGKGFNYKNVILSALDFGSIYWDALALRWLENEDVKLDEDIISMLKTKLDLGEFNQSNKHIALRLIKKFKM